MVSLVAAAGSEMTVFIESAVVQFDVIGSPRITLPQAGQVRRSGRRIAFGVSVAEQLESPILHLFFHQLHRGGCSQGSPVTSDHAGWYMQVFLAEYLVDDSKVYEAAVVEFEVGGWFLNTTLLELQRPG